MTNARHLDDALSTLRSEIHALDVGDEVTKRRLDGLVLEIAASIERSKGAVPDENLTERLKASVLNFEVTHPRLAVLMNDVLEKLSTMGV